MVQAEVRAVVGLPGVQGAHEWAWALLLDRVFADAFHARVAGLRLTLPSVELAERARLRGSLGAGPAQAAGWAAAWLVGGPPGPSTVGADRLYTLEAAGWAPRGVRALLPPVQAARGWRLDQVWGFYGWQARWLGVPLRAAQVLRRPDWADRVTHAVRPRFATRGRSPAYYRLKLWTPA